MSDLLTNLLQIRKEREHKWTELFQKYSKSDEDSVSYSIENIPLSIECDVSTNEIQSANAKLVNLIENKLDSNLKKLALKREKAKIFIDHPNYYVWHKELKKEMKRLSKHVTKDEFKLYFSVCVKPNVQNASFIEKVLQRNSDFDKWKLKLLQEWSCVTRELSEEDVIVYAVNVLKANNL